MLDGMHGRCEKHLRSCLAAEHLANSRFNDFKRYTSYYDYSQSYVHDYLKGDFNDVRKNHVYDHKSYLHDLGDCKAYTHRRVNLHSKRR